MRKFLKLRLSRWRQTSLGFYWIFILTRSVSDALSRRQRIFVSPFLAYASGYESGRMRNLKVRKRGQELGRIPR